MKLECIVIPREESSIEIYHDTHVDDLMGHVSSLRNFVICYGIYSYEEIRNWNSYQLSVQLASFGYLNIHLEGDVSVFYLPYMLDERQYQYIKDRIRAFSRFDIKMVNMGDRSDKIEFVEQGLCERTNLLSRLQKEIKKRRKRYNGIDSVVSKEKIRRIDGDIS